MGTGIQDLQDMNNSVVDGGQSDYRVVDPNFLLNLQFQGVQPFVHNHPPFDPTLSAYGFSCDDRFDYDQPTLYYDNTIELRKDQHLVFEPNSFVDLSGMSSGLNASNSTSNGDLDSPEDSEGFSDILLSYINQLLMEEDLDDKFDIYSQHPALLAAEKNFYEILEEKLPGSPDKPTSYSSLSSESVEENIGKSLSYSDGGNNINLLPIDTIWPHDAVEYQYLQRNQTVIDFTSQSFYSTNSFSYAVERQDPLKNSELYVEASPTCQIQRRLKETQTLLRSTEKSHVDINVNGHCVCSSQATKEELQLNETRKLSDQISTDRKNPQHDELDVLEGRSKKHPATSFDDRFHNNDSHNDTLEEVLLSDGVTDGYQMKLQVEASQSPQDNHAKGTGRGRSRGKRQPKKEVVDLRTILIQCAQSVSSGDGRTANDLLKRIRQHSSPYGDANERLAHYFAHGLEARLAGTGTQVYNKIYTTKLSVTDVLKAYKLYTTASPFKKVSHFFSDQTILKVAKNTMRLHIIDFGIYYGLQWPCFMQRLSKRPGGPPKLRITGIDLPLRGFRPTELVDDTGCRLSEYARKFDIPFEFQAIATKWETLQVEDLNIDDDEVLVVNSLYRFNSLMDESVAADSPRNIVMNLIRKLKPAVFIHGIVNGSYGVPFFLSRFREALFNFSSLFDMIEANTPREDESRLLIEKLLLGRDAISVIACEGSDRNERPETYKQWQIRTVNAGFTQNPVDKSIMKKVKDKVKACYHKDFVIDEDSQWLLLGWKGRILHALSTWKPNYSS